VGCQDISAKHAVDRLSEGSIAPGYAVGVNRARRVCLLIFLAGAGLASGLAQPPGKVDSTTVLRLAVDKYEKAKDSKTRFTYLQLNHIQTSTKRARRRLITRSFSKSHTLLTWNTRGCLKSTARHFQEGLLKQNRSGMTMLCGSGRRSMDLRARRFNIRRCWMPG
jgi:hypothetical protein